MAFPQMKGKHKENALFSPKMFLKYRVKTLKLKTNFPKNIIFCYSRKLFEYVQENYKLRKINALSSLYDNFYSLVKTKNKIGVIAKFGIGAPTVATIMEELIAAGAKRFISVGTAGSLQPNIKLGSIIICDKAIRDEGTSHHYLPPSKYSYPTKTMLEKTKRIANAFAINYSMGTTWTIDTPYRETIAEIRKYRKEGVITVEMEAAAIFAVAKYRHVEAGAIFTISDYLGELQWQPKFHMTKNYLGQIFEVARVALS